MLGFALSGLVAAGIVAGINVIVSGANSSILGLLRQIAISFDSVVYTLASWSYGIFYELSASSLLSSLNLASASQRLYTLLGIFMLFRLAFSFIKYIVNPDDMEKGTSKFITNLAVSLALIVSVPWIFNRAFQLQTYIMESNVIGNLILGMDMDRSDEDTFNASSYGQSIAFMVFSAFYRPNSSSISGLEPCENILIYYNDYIEPDSNGQVKYNGNAKDAAVAKESEKIAACINALNNVDGKIKYIFDDKTSPVELGTMFYIASQRRDMSILTNPAVFRAHVSESYVVNYTSIVSTIALGFLALLFINYSFDVAIRNVKLCFLQIIAPIPIILNIEPGDAKGDKKSLNWWVKECLRTYVDLFIRVATVYFGVFLINILFTGSSVLGSTNTSTWFCVFMILGILLFVKQIPEMIGKAFGIDVKGQFSLNPLKRLRENKLTGTLIGASAGLITGHSLGSMFRGGRAGYAGRRTAEILREESARRNDIRESNRLSPHFQANENDSFGQRVFKRMGRGVYGSFSRGVERVNQTFGTHIGGDNVPTSANIASRIRDIDEGITGRGIRQVNQAIEEQGVRKREITNEIADAQRHIQDLSNVANSGKAMEDRAVARVMDGHGAAGREYVRRRGEIEAERNRVITADRNLLNQLDEAKTRLTTLRNTKPKNATDIKNLTREYRECQEQITNLNTMIDADVANQERERGANIAQWEQRLNNDLHGNLRNSYMDEAIANHDEDATFNNLYSDFQQNARYAGRDTYNERAIDQLSGADLHALFGTVNGDIGTAKRQIADRQRDIAAADREIERYNAEKDRLQEQKNALENNRAYADVNARIAGARGPGGNHK